MKFSLGKFLGAAGIAVKAFLHKPTPPEELIETAVELAKTARQGGLLALEDAESGELIAEYDEGSWRPDDWSDRCGSG